MTPPGLPAPRGPLSEGLIAVLRGSPEEVDHSLAGSVDGVFGADFQLKEADPHSWAIPRLSGAAKAALVEVQADEYGGGRPDRVHATLFAKALAGAGPHDAHGAHPHP